MHPFFAPLTPEQVSLLLIGIVRCEKNATNLFQHQPESLAAQLLEKANALFELPEQKRISFVVRSLRNLRQQQQHHHLSRIHPSWIVHALYGESPEVLHAILAQLDNNLQSEIKRYLPTAIQQHLSQLKPEPNIYPALIMPLMSNFYARFPQFPDPPVSTIELSHLVYLDRRDLLRCIRECGLTELAQAFRAVGRSALAELCRRIPRDSANELIDAVKASSGYQERDDKSARHFLSRLAINFQHPEELFHKAGLWQIAKSIGPNTTLAPLVAYCLPLKLGQALLAFTKKNNNLSPLTPPQQLALQNSILALLQNLAQRKCIAQRWEKFSLSTTSQPTDATPNPDDA